MRALRAYPNLAEAIGPVRARGALCEAHILPSDQAVALVHSLHTTLVRERDDVLAAQRALQMIRAEAADEAAPTSEDTMTITELADALGVRTSTFRFWEKAGLAIPARVTLRVGTAQRYPLAAIREARITATVRAAGYRIPDVQNTMRSIRQLHDVDEPYQALENRVEAVAQRTRALLRAGTELADIGGGQAGADVEERVDAGLVGEVLDGPYQECAVGLGDLADVGQDFEVLVAGFAVDSVVVLVVEPIVPDPCGMRHGRLDAAAGGSLA